jgi:hypothetical protein
MRHGHYSGLCAQVGSGASASLRTGQPRLTPVKVANIGIVMSGQNMLLFDLWGTEARSSVFAASYAAGKVTADGLYEVPDGYEITQTRACSSSVTTQQMTGETSLMKAQTNQISFDVTAGYGPVKGSLKNSLEFKTESKKMSNTDSYLQVSSLSCTLYQVTHNQYDPAGLTKNFANGIMTLHRALSAGGERPAEPPRRKGEAPSWCTLKACQSFFLKGAGSSTPEDAALGFLENFGTHYMMRGSLGSAFMSTTSTTKEQLSELQNSSTKLDVGASVSFWDQSVGSSVLSEVEKAEASSFQKLSESFISKTIGVKMPAGNSKVEVMINWQEDTLNSNGLALVGGLHFSRLDALLATDSALDQVNTAIGNGTNRLEQKELDAVRVLLTKTIEGYCQALGYDCDPPSPDKPLPPPASGRGETPRRSVRMVAGPLVPVPRRQPGLHRQAVRRGHADLRHPPHQDRHLLV